MYSKPTPFVELEALALVNHNRFVCHTEWNTAHVQNTVYSR